MAQDRRDRERIEVARMIGSDHKAPVLGQMLGLESLHTEDHPHQQVGRHGHRAARLGEESFGLRPNAASCQLGRETTRGAGLPSHVQDRRFALRKRGHSTGLVS